jgi:outer membrane lipoprotein SlyB
MARTRKNHDPHREDIIPGAVLGGLLGNVFVPGLGGTVAGSIIGALLASRSDTRKSKHNGET